MNAKNQAESSIQLLDVNDHHEHGRNTLQLGKWYSRSKTFPEIFIITYVSLTQVSFLKFLTSLHGRLAQLQYTASFYHYHYIYSALIILNVMLNHLWLVFHAFLTLMDEVDCLLVVARGCS